MNMANTYEKSRKGVHHHQVNNDFNIRGLNNGNEKLAVDNNSYLDKVVSSMSHWQAFYQAKLCSTCLWEKLVRCCNYFCLIDSSTCNQSSPWSVVLEQFHIEDQSKLPKELKQPLQEWTVRQLGLTAEFCQRKGLNTGTATEKWTTRCNTDRKAGNSHHYGFCENLLNRCCESWLCFPSILIWPYAICPHYLWR